MYDLMPPHDLDAELKLIGGILNDKDQYMLVESILPAGAETFYNLRHQALYKAIERILKEDKPLELSLVTTEANKVNQDITIADVYKAESAIPTGELCEYYSSVISELFAKRKVMEACKIALTNIKDNDVIETVGTLEKSITEASAKGKQLYADNMSDIALSWWERYIDTEGETGDRIYTGWRDLDKYLAIVPGTHMMVAARTSQGKTSFAINLATNVAKQGKRPIIFTMEQTKESVATCYVAQIAGVDRFRAMTGTMFPHDKKKVSDTAYVWGSNEINNIGIYDKPCNAQAIRHKIIMERQRNPVDMVIIDFLHNMKPPTGYSSEGHEWLRETTTQLEHIAVELRVPIITLAQVNRKVEGRDDKRPNLSDIREAGEDNVDIALFIYRDEYYNKDSRDKGIAEIIIAKNRHGKTGMVKLKFIDYSTAFKDLDAEVAEIDLLATKPYIEPPEKQGSMWYESM